MKIKWRDCPGPKPELKEKNGVLWLSFPLLEQTGIVVQGFTTRIGGVSRGIFSAMNLGSSRGDDPEAVRENFRLAAGALGIPADSLTATVQTPTNHVRRVGAGDRGSGITRPSEYTDVDGLLCGEPEVALTAFFADCVPLFFVDPVRRAIALAHSGWRGTVRRIGRVTVEQMKKEFGTRPEDLVAAVGPSICRDCYEVGEEVAEQFARSFGPEAESAILEKKENGKYQLDLWEANRRVLLEAGLRPEKIQLPWLCTCCNPELLFSHRATGGKRGNMAAFLMLKKQG